MKIKSITGEDPFFIVTLTPEWIEIIFGVKERELKIKDINKFFSLGGISHYVTSDGKNLRDDYGWIAEAIDNHRRKF